MARPPNPETSDGLPRVLQVMAGARHGGAEAFFTRLVAALQGAGLAQRAVIRHHAKRAQALRGAGVTVVELPFGGLLDWRTRRRLGDEISAFDPQLVVTWMNRATRHCPDGDFVHAARLGGYYDLKYYKRCHHLIANTDAIADYIVAAGWPREGTHVLPNFAGARTSPGLDRGQHQTPPRAPLLLGLGRLHENKAFDVLIAAMPRLPEMHLWLAGSGPLQRQLETLAAGSGAAERIHFLGWRDDTAALFAAADIFVCPSRHEPFGNVVVEAWAQGVPVVAAESAGPAALITDGEDGLLVATDDAAALATAIQRIANDPAQAKRLAEAGRRRYEGGFSETVVVGKYLALFSQLSQR